MSIKSQTHPWIQPGGFTWKKKIPKWGHFLRCWGVTEGLHMGPRLKSVPSLLSVWSFYLATVPRPTMTFVSLETICRLCDSSISRRRRQYTNDFLGTKMRSASTCSVLVNNEQACQIGFMWATKENPALRHPGTESEGGGNEGRAGDLSLSLALTTVYLHLVICLWLQLCVA